MKKLVIIITSLIVLCGIISTVNFYRYYKNISNSDRQNGDNQSISIMNLQPNNVKVLSSDGEINLSQKDVDYNDIVISNNILFKNADLEYVEDYSNITFNKEIKYLFDNPIEIEVSINSVISKMEIKKIAFGYSENRIFNVIIINNSEDTISYYFCKNKME